MTKSEKKNGNGIRLKVIGIPIITLLGAAFASLGWFYSLHNDAMKKIEKNYDEIGILKVKGAEKAIDLKHIKDDMKDLKTEQKQIRVEQREGFDRIQDTLDGMRNP